MEYCPATVHLSKRAQSVASSGNHTTLIILSGLRHAQPLNNLRSPDLGQAKAFLGLIDLLSRCESQVAPSVLYVAQQAAKQSGIDGKHESTQTRMKVSTVNTRRLR